MDYRDIQIFCDLCRTHNITATAEHLFLTQPAITRRIRNLEEDLGIPLFVRGKGKTGVELTLYGERFLPLAEQWLSIDECARNIKNETPRIQLSFGGIDSVVSYLLSDFFAEYLIRNQQVDLNLYTYNTWDVYSHLESGELDVGITHSNSTIPKAGPANYRANLEITPLFVEPYVVLISWDLGRLLPDKAAILPENLDPLHEVYAEFDMGLRKWHLRTWPSEQPRMYAMGSISLIIPQLLGRPKSWSIVPLSVARILCNRYPLSWRKLAGNVPQRSCCVGVNKKTDSVKVQAACLFIKELLDYLERDSLHCILPPGSDE